MAAPLDQKPGSCLVTSIYFNYYQAERELQHNPRPECGINVMPEDISRFPTIPFNAVAFAMDATCKNAYKENKFCEGCSSSEKCYRKQKLKLHAEFKGEPNTTILIRTQDPIKQNVKGLDAYLEKARVGMDDDKPMTSKRLLGDIEPVTVMFNDRGNSYVEGQEDNGVIELTLANADIWSHGICASWQLWQWQCSTDGGKTWQAIEGLFHEGISVHRIFVTKDVAAWPWTGYDEDIKHVSGQHAISRPPYIGALEWACKWAAGETTVAGITAKITAGINDGSGDRFKYELTGANNYTSIYHNYFDCGRFIDRLNGKFGRGPNVNCVDCAHMVIALANALGCRLQAGKIRNTDHSVPFELNPVVLIGHTEVAKSLTSFAYHQVAFAPGSDDTQPDKVYDACIKFDKEVFKSVQKLEPSSDKGSPPPAQQKHGHPVDLPLGTSVFTYGYMAVLAKPIKVPSQENLAMQKGEDQIFSISALKF